MRGRLAGLLLIALPFLTLGDDPLTPLPNLPSQFTTSLMWNLKMTPTEEGKPPVAMTFSIWETIDSNKIKSLIEIISENTYTDDEGTVVRVIESEKIVWRPGGSGVERYLDIVQAFNGDEKGIFCMADSHKDDSFVDFLFGFDMDTDEGFPSVMNMLHWGDKNYTYQGKVESQNGIPSLKFSGIWKVDEWSAVLDVQYFWSDPELWEETAGIGASVPVAIIIMGVIKSGGEDFNLVLNIDFSDFYEIAMPEQFFQPPQDLWCEGRQMDMKLPEITDHFTVETEILFEFPDENGVWNKLITSRSEWYDGVLQVSRADYKPPDFTGSNPDPWTNNNGFISQIHDYNTGLMYSIDRTFGNCTIEYLDESADGMDEHGHGHIHMASPFHMFAHDQFYYNGEFDQRGFKVDSFIRYAPLFRNVSGNVDNFTTVVMLTALDWEVDNSGEQQRLVPTRVLRYPSMQYNERGGKLSASYFNLREYRGDTIDFDISMCIADDNKIHLMARLGWDENMDIDNNQREFRVAAAMAVVIYGHVTPIRVQNIEAVADEDNKSLFMIFTIIGYPPGFDYLLNELPDAIRGIDEIRTNLQNAIDGGNFGVEVIGKNGQLIKAIAEAGSLIELGDRNGNYNYNDGYSSGAMAACGIILLLVSIFGFGALCIFVLKF